MKKLICTIASSYFLSVALVLPAQEGTDKKTVKKDEPKAEAASYMDDFINRRPYIRDEYRNLRSPFRNLIVAEQIKQKKIEEEKARLAELEKAQNQMGTSTTPVPETTEQQATTVTAVDLAEQKFKMLQSIRQKIDTVNQLVESRNYQEAETLLKNMSLNLFKFKIEDPLKDEVEKRRSEVEAERKDWEEINKIIGSLRVQAMFVTAGGKNIALLNSAAVEVGDDLNVELNLSKDAPVILTHVSNNSIRIKFKKFELKKDIVDNE